MGKKSTAMTHKAQYDKVSHIFTMMYVLDHVGSSNNVSYLY